MYWRLPLGLGVFGYLKSLSLRLGSISWASSDGAKLGRGLTGGILLPLILILLLELALGVPEACE